MYEVAGQLGDVGAALAQRRYLQRHHLQPIEQVLAELALGNQARQVAVGRRQDAQVDLQRLFTAHALEGALLQHAQQLDLHGGRDLADLV